MTDNRDVVIETVITSDYRYEVRVSNTIQDNRWDWVIFERSRCKPDEAPIEFGELLPLIKPLRKGYTGSRVESWLEAKDNFSKLLGSYYVREFGDLHIPIYNDSIKVYQY